MLQGVEARLGPGTAGGSPRNPDDDERVLTLGRRQLASWVRLERLTCRVKRGPDGERAAVTFSMRLGLAQLARTWLDLDMQGSSSVRVRVRGEGEGLRIAGRVVTAESTAWFSLALDLRSRRDELGLVVRELLRFGPAPVDAREVLRIIGAPLDMFKDRPLELPQSWIRPFPLLAAALKRSPGLRLPERLVPLKVTATVLGDRLQIEGEPLMGEEEPIHPIHPAPSALSEQIDAALQRGDLEGVRGLLSHLSAGDPLAEHGFYELVRRSRTLFPHELARVRRAAQAGVAEALCALIAHHRLIGQHHRASHWYRQLARVAAGLDPLTAWAVGEAQGAHFAELTRVDLPAGVAATLRSAKPYSANDESEPEWTEEWRDMTVEVALPALDLEAGSSTARLAPLLEGEPGRRASPETAPDVPAAAPAPSVSTAAQTVVSPVPSSAPAEKTGPAAVQMPAPSAEGRSPLQSGPLTRELLSRTREAFEAREDWRGLLQLLEETLAASPSAEDRSLLHHELAQIKVALGVPSRAAPHFEALLEANPDDSEAIEFLRAHYTREGLHEPRIRLEAVVARKLPGAKGSRALAALAAEAATHEHFALSRELLTEACAANPADGALLSRLTAELEPLGEWDSLVEAWKRRLPMLLQSPEKLQAGLRIAGYLRKKGDLEGAERLYRGVLRSDPEQGEALRGLAEVLEARGEWSAMGDVLQRLSRHLTGGDRAEVALRLADLYAHHLEDAEIADSWYREALAEAPGDDRAARGVIRQLEARGDFEGLVAFLEKRLDQVTAPALRKELLLLLGDVYLARLGNQGRALACFQEAEAL